MPRTVKIIAFLFAFFASILSLQLNHAYFSLETAEYVDKTQSIIELNKCKAECLQMKQYFPFRFRYHRLIIRQLDGMVKYFIGHCQIKMLKKDYQEWQNLKDYIVSTNLFGENDIMNKGEVQIWQNYNQICEDKRLEMTKIAMESMKLTRTHSNFYYNDDGSFQNSEPFNDIGTLFANIHKMS